MPHYIQLNIIPMKLWWHGGYACTCQQGAGVLPIVLTYSDVALYNYGRVHAHTILQLPGRATVVADIP